MIAALVLLASLSSSAEPSSAENCRTCHLRLSPVQVHIFDDSAHAAAGLDCQSCHGRDTQKAHQGAAIVDAKMCGRCHARALAQHQRGKHGIGFRAGRACTRKGPRGEQIRGECVSCHEPDTARPRQEVECARFLAQSPAMQRQGCLACHKIERRCDACHGSHDTRREVARAPATCGTCHLGPDHAQMEMWQSSRHGVLYAIDGESKAPSCVSCHMVDGDHDVSQGISMGLAGQPYPESERAWQRKKMLHVCQRCHAPSFARRQLRDADRIQRESKKIVDEARALVESLHREGLLQPSVEQRPPHPLSGPRLVLGPQMLYQDLSRAEAIFFRMKKFFYVTAYKGAFHQSPDYAHWYGNAPLRLALSELRSEASLLRGQADLEHRSAVAPGGHDSLQKALRELKDQRRQGLLDEPSYRRAQEDVLKNHGL